MCHPDKQVVWFPKTKYETRDRQIPVHHRIKHSLGYWMINGLELFAIGM